MAAIRDIALPTAALVIGAFVIIIAIIGKIETEKFRISLSRKQSILLGVNGIILLIVGIVGYFAPLGLPIPPEPSTATTTATTTPTRAPTITRTRTPIPVNFVLPTVCIRHSVDVHTGPGADSGLLENAPALDVGKCPLIGGRNIDDTWYMIAYNQPDPEYQPYEGGWIRQDQFDLSTPVFVPKIALTPIPSPAGPTSTPSKPAPSVTRKSKPTRSVTPNPTLTLQAVFDEIDQQFEGTMRSYIAFNKPEQMKLNETVSVELILNPSSLKPDLATQIVERGNMATSAAEPGVLVMPGGQKVNIETGEIEITPRMKAVLRSQNPDTFVIVEMHDNPEQVISSVDTTVWRWSITAKQEGPQTLELIIYQLVKYEGKDNWHEVVAYKADIIVQVTLADRLKSWDWKWIATALLIPLVGAIWGWWRKRKNEREQPSHSAPKVRKKTK